MEKINLIQGNIFIGTTDNKYTTDFYQKHTNLCKQAMQIKNWSMNNLQILNSGGSFHHMKDNNFLFQIKAEDDAFRANSNICNLFEPKADIAKKFIAELNKTHNSMLILYTVSNNKNSRLAIKASVLTPFDDTQLMNAMDTLDI